MSEGSVERAGSKRPNEDDIASKMLMIQNKRFYVDVKQNHRGRFIKIAEMGANHKSRIVLSMMAAISLRDKIQELIDYSDSHPEDEVEEESDLKSEVLIFDTRRYYLDLRQNKRGRFLRIAQTVSVPRMFRTQVVIPGAGIADLLSALRDLIVQYSEGYIQTAPTNLPETTHLKSGSKMFYFDAGHNDIGSYLRVSEVKQVSGYRSSVTIPTDNLIKFRDAINEMIEKFEQAGVKMDSDVVGDTEA